MTLAELLRTLKDARHLSEAKLARRAGLPPGTLKKYLHGQRLPTLPAAAAVARAAGRESGCPGRRGRNQGVLSASARPAAPSAAEGGANSRGGCAGGAVLTRAPPQGETFR